MIDGILVTKTNERRSVQLTVAPHNLTVSATNSASDILSTIYSLNIHTVQFDLGGNNKSLVFVNAPELQGEVVYFEATHSHLKQLKENASTAEKIQTLSQQKNQSARMTSYFVLLFFLFLGLLFYFRGPIAGSLSSLIPYSWEKKSADKLFSGKKTPEQMAVIRKLHELGEHLKFNPAEWPHEFTFHISSEVTPNAYATLGGHVFVNKGLITSLETSEDLLGVVAHEMIHVQQRHVVKSVIQGLGLYTVLSILIGDITGVAAVLVDQGGPLLNLSYSRELEEEADALGMKLLVKNNIDPSGLATSLQSISNYQKKLIAESPGSEVLEKLQKIELLNSHPEIEKRIENLLLQADVYKRSQKFESLKFDYDKFKTTVKENF